MQMNRGLTPITVASSGGATTTTAGSAARLRAVPLAAAVLAVGCTLAGCDLGSSSGGGLGGGGGGRSVDLRSFEIRGTDGFVGNGNTAPANVDTLSVNPLFFEWDVSARGVNSAYRAEGFLISRGGSNAGQEIEVLGRNCSTGVTTGCDQGFNSFECRFVTGSGGTVIACPPDEGNTTETRLSSFFSDSVGLPGEYDVRLEVCVLTEGSGTSAFDEICRDRVTRVFFR